MDRPFPELLWSFVAENKGSILWADEASGHIYVLLPELTGFEDRLVGILGPPIWRVRHMHQLELAYRERRLYVMDRLEWRGIKLADTATIRANSSAGPRCIPILTDTVAAPILWLLRLLTGADVPDRLHATVLRAIRTNDELTFALLEHATGRYWATRLIALAGDGYPPQAEFIRALRRAVLRRGMRHAYATVVGCLQDWRTGLARWRRPPVGWVALVGPDGTGKSSVRAGVQAKLSREFSGFLAMHWRPGFFGHSDSGAAETVRQPHAAPLRGSFVSVLKLAFLAFDWGFGNLFLIRPARGAGRLVLFDRHYVDILVDPRRYRYGGPAWLAALVAGLVPSPDLWIVLDAPPEIIRSRKDEVGAEELACLRVCYLQLAARLENAQVVDVTVALEEVVDRVAELILDMVSRRTETDRVLSSRSAHDYRPA